jgi:outer membrane biosynthesis protein TonB
MKSALTSRYRRFSSKETPAGKKDNQEQTFFADSHQPAFFSPATSIQRKCDDCEKKDKVTDLLKEKKKDEKVVVVVADKDKEKKLKKKENEELKKKSKEEEKKEKVIVIVADKEKDKKKLLKKEEEKEKVMKKEEEKEIKKKESSSAAVSPGASVSNYVGALNGKGTSLSKQSQQFFGSKMDADFSNVKIHTDKEAAESASAINARAYTAGEHIVFNEGEYNDSTDSGKKLLAHELTHVIQQKS